MARAPVVEYQRGTENSLPVLPGREVYRHNEGASRVALMTLLPLGSLTCGSMSSMEWVGEAVATPQAGRAALALTAIRRNDGHVILRPKRNAL
jgi:hypothetical protein